MSTVGLLALFPAALAAAAHCYFFVLESVRFDRPATWQIFGVPDAEAAAAARPWAYNQGFYNLFLAVGTGCGIVLAALGRTTVGITLIVFGCASMLAAALVLIASDSGKRRAALVQGTPPALVLLLLAAGRL